MASPPNEGLELLQEMTKAAPSAPPPPSPRARAFEPKNEGEALLHEMTQPPTSGGEARPNSFEGSPAIPFLPPTIPQQMAAGPVKGLSALADVPNLIAGGATHAAAALSKINPINNLLAPENTKKAADQWSQLANRFLEGTGENGLIARNARVAGITPEDPGWSPTDFFGRALFNINDLGTQLIAGGGLGKGLQALTKMPEMVGAARSAVTPAALSLSRAIAPSPFLEASVPVAGGVAGAAAHALAPSNHNAEDLAMAAGSMAPLVARAVVPRMLIAAAKDDYGFFTRPGENATGKRLAGLLGKEPRQLLDEFTAAKGQPATALGPGTPPTLPSIEGWSPTPGMMTGNRALLGQERKAADISTPFGDPLNPGSRITPGELQGRNTEALEQELKGAGPQGDPLLATHGAKADIAAQQAEALRVATQQRTEADRLEAAAQQAQRVVEAQMPPIAPSDRTAARAAAANRFHGALENAEDAAVTQGGHLFDAVDPDKTATVPMYRLRDALEEVTATAAERGRMDALPPVMRKPTIGDNGGPPLHGDKIDDYLHSWQLEQEPPKFLANVPYERVKGLRSRLTTLQRDATDPQQREFYGRLISGVDQAVSESATGGLAERYNTARTFWRENVAEPFREGVVANILKNDKNYTGAGQLLAPGERGAQNIQQLVPTIRRDPELYQATVDHARADMVATTTDVNGRVNGTKLREWVDKHAPVLEHFPELQQEFTRLAQAQHTADDYLRHAEANSPTLRALADRGIKNTEDNIRNSAARFYLNAEPEDVIRGLVGLRGSERAKMAEQAMAMLKTPQAKEGLQRAYYDYLIKKVLGGEEREAVKGNWRSNFANTLDNESDLANVLLPPGVRSRLRSFDKALQADTSRQRATANAGSRSSEDAGSVLTQIARNWINLPTVTGGATAGAVIGSAVPVVGTGFGAAAGAVSAAVTRRLILARMAAQEAAMREAIFNPAIYERVMSSASLTPAVRKMMNKAIRPYLIIANTEAATDEARDAGR